MAKKNDYIVVFVTCANEAQANNIGRKLLKNKLAACVNKVKVNSIFTWQGKIEKAREVLLTIKTKKNLFRKVEKTVKSLHSYEVAEIIALPIITANSQYLDWIKESTD
ncbi:MAG: divalent-cation tolerance protein CutA [Candidatus Omnitrophica bacterium]|nr:divalent-cation tolerance protein CutA [Candidatus Omnitrophota bacterium]